MRTKTLLLMTAALLAASAPLPASGQHSGIPIVDRIASSLSPAGYEATAVAQAGYADPCYAEDFYCANGRCGDCVGCCRQYDVWGSAEMLLWWAKGTPLPPLVTTSPPGTDPTLDNPNTRVLFGDELGADNVQFGWRVAAGVWLDEAHNSAAGARFWMLGGDTSQFSATSDGSPIIGRPFFDAQLGVQDSLLVASEGISRGSIHARLAQQNTIGAEGFVEWMVDRNCCRRIDVLLGYQFLRLDDWLEIINDTTDELIIPGTFFEVTDRFSTQNEFHGAEIGMRGRWASGCWSLDALGKIGAGNMRQQVTISGRTDVTFLGNTATNNTGLLAQATNIGTYERDRFVVVPELTVNLKYHATRNLSFHVGYNLIWISEVALSGEQIDLVVNPAPQLSGPQRPAFDFADDDYWLQGINFGMNWDY